MIFAVPAVTPVTTPVDATTDATLALPLLHAPPVGVLLKVVVPPTHRFSVPVTGEGPVDDASVIVAVALRDMSPSASLEKYTAFTVARSVTAPVPAAGAFHGTSIT